MSSLPITSKVYTIKRAYAHAFYSIRVNEAQSVIAFKNKAAAQRFVNLEYQMGGKQCQPMKLEHMNLSVLWRRCSQNALGLVLYKDDSEYEVMPKMKLSVDDLMFYYDNNLRFVL